jgi:hypothetical protein
LGLCAKIKIISCYLRYLSVFLHFSERFNFQCDFNQHPAGRLSSSLARLSAIYC